MQVSFWIIALSFPFLIQIKNLPFDPFSNYRICENLIVGLWFIGNFYLLYGYLVPGLLIKNKFRLFVLSLLSYLILSPIIIGFLLLLNKTLFSIPAQESMTFKGFLGGLFGSIISGGIGLSYRIIVNWVYDAQHKTELENRNPEPDR